MPAMALIAARATFDANPLKKKTPHEPTYIKREDRVDGQQGNALTAVPLAFLARLEQRLQVLCVLVRRANEALDQRMRVPVMVRMAIVPSHTHAWQ